LNTEANQYHKARVDHFFTEIADLDYQDRHSTNLKGKAPQYADIAVQSWPVLRTNDSYRPDLWV